MKKSTNALRPTVLGFIAVFTLGISVITWATPGSVDPLIPPVYPGNSQLGQKCGASGASAKCRDLACSQIPPVINGQNWTISYGGFTFSGSGQPPTIYGKFASSGSLYTRCGPSQPVGGVYPTCANDQNDQCGQFQVHSNSTCAAPYQNNPPKSGYILYCH